MCYIPVYLVYGRRDICSFSFWTRGKDLFDRYMYICEREGVTACQMQEMLFNSLIPSIIWSVLPTLTISGPTIDFFFFFPQIPSTRNHVNLSCHKAQEWKAWKCAAVVIKNINNKKKINSKNPAFTEH